MSYMSTASTHSSIRTFTGAAAIALSNHVRYHPAPFALLNLVDLEAQHLGASKTAADE